MPLTSADFLAIDITLLILAIISIIGNGFILTVFFTHRNLRKNRDLYLLMALATNDVAIAIFDFPYVIFLIANWGPVIDYPPVPMVYLILPPIVTQRIAYILICAIAIDRFYAVQWPVQYRAKSKNIYLIKTLIVAICSGLLEAILFRVTTTIQPVPGCAAGICFLGTGYRLVGGIQTILINASTCILAIVLLFQLRKLKAAENEQEQENFRSANRIAVLILAFCVIFKLLPNTFTTFGGLMGLTLAKSFGPYSSFAVLVCGIANSVIYGSKHHAIRQTISAMRSSVAPSAGRAYLPAGKPAEGMAVAAV